ncbi:hypothetical protein [Candidatus Methylacidithermus pantelleriae]|uniref:Uncharacterized protein n=1 Tax=Candidatus Methylacidithermus pantelleriae TaxID=2744239 RepID=A0A8J2BR42_9BACT|nr:hypothetical protein [Candidatus Methylacidithermus pantelleriae]CAF0705074.1 hypothetical protein MPNT_80097 [Candidatus Methylacidithermus pantelleriae]
MSDRAQRESRVAFASEVSAESPKTIAKKADPVALGNPVDRALFSLQAHKYVEVRGQP